ncbi:MAG TPA: hypothetical protein VFB58_01130 [Chloroflexota bacterium]|nr:hypothetical protein [Chloroflexota bacterium]
MGLRELYRTQIARERQLREQVSAPVTTEDWFWGRIGTTGSEEDYFWRRLSDNWTQKDVLPSTYLEIHNQVYEAYNANPLANAIVEMGVNFTLGDGLQIDARHKKVQRLIDAFWHDPDNHMALRQFDIATELSLYGEVFIRCFVNPYSGHLKIGQIDPSLIDEIECDPDNIEKQIRCHRRSLGQTNAPTTTVTAPTPNPGPGVMQGSIEPDPKFVNGEWFAMPDEVMHFAINKVANAKRGKSDLATILPWLRRYKDWLIDRVRINKYKSAFLWDVTLTGANRQAIEAKMMEYARPPEPGTVLIHNESEEWKAVQPLIDAGNVAADGQAIKIMVAMGAGLPEHYLSEGGDVNRATASEMSLPVLKRYQRRQDMLAHIFRALLDRAIAEAQDAGTLPRTIDTTYTLTFPELRTEDSSDIGMGAYHMSQALQAGVGLGIISRETATALLIGATRTDVDVREELERIAAERGDGA